MALLLRACPDNEMPLQRAERFAVALVSPESAVSQGLRGELCKSSLDVGHVQDGETATTANHANEPCSAARGEMAPPTDHMPPEMRHSTTNGPENDVDQACHPNLGERNHVEDCAASALVEQAVLPCCPALVDSWSIELFKNESFEIRTSQVAGLGAFATKDLSKGDVILRERPLFIAHRDHIFVEFAKLDERDKEVALSLYANQLLKPGISMLEAIWKTNW
ncbi:hypothetical protein UVI_02002400 [Ustilaginoidea virens]|uniref:SET domain-containing protein n=1 Tax=Ustilaginoidea virens TaxID=1159556 RepID=A0A1B5L2J6_USTVR|nr:hypothetical protein UVI_02002400 [Ustilaginoidea virens]